MTAGDNAKGLKLLQQAAGLKPDQPEILYDLGVAHYRTGDYATAADYFLKALSGSNLGLEQRARFNLGNCAYAEGLKKQQDPRRRLRNSRQRPTASARRCSSIRTTAMPVRIWNARG